jgi:hypothetical protein
MNRGSLDAAQIEFLERIFAGLPRLIEDSLCILFLTRSSPRLPEQKATRWSTEWLQAIAWSMIIVQACDGFMGTTIKDRMKTFGPAGTALLNLVAVLWLIQAVP